MQEHNAKTVDDIKQLVKEKDDRIDKYIKAKKENPANKLRNEKSSLLLIIEACEKLKKKEDILKLKKKNLIGNEEINEINFKINEGYKDPWLTKKKLKNPEDLQKYLKKLIKQKEIEEDAEDIQKIESKIKLIHDLLAKIDIRNDLMNKEREKNNCNQLFDQISSDDVFAQFYTICFEFLKKCENKNIKDLSYLYKASEDMLLSDYRSVEKIFRQIEKKYEDFFDNYEVLMDFSSNEEEKNENGEAARKHLEMFNKFSNFLKENPFLSELENDLKRYPIKCYERLILQLIFDIESTKITDISEIKKKMTDIEAQLEEESLLTCFEVKEKVENIKHSEVISMKAYLNSLNQLRKILIPLNVFEIERLLMKTKKSAAKIKDQEIILFIGETGAGKSTTICYLAGCKMVKASNNDINIDPKFKPKFTCKISSKTKSETKSINPIEIDLSTKQNSKKKKTILCDTPGYNDTDGPEADISNGIGVIDAIKGCKGVKPVMVFNKCNMGKRFQDVEKSLYILIGMISDLKFNLKPIDYLFTGFEKSEFKEIKNKLEDLKDYKNSMPKTPKDELLVLILDDMIGKISKEKIIDPLDGHPEDLLENLITDNNYITNCSEILQFDISEDSKNTILKCFHTLKKSIIVHINIDNLEIAKFRFSLMKLLIKNVQIKENEEFFNDTVGEVTKYYESIFKNCCEKFNKGVHYGNMFTEEDQKEYDNMIKFSKKIKEVLQDFIGEKLSFEKHFEENLIQIMDKLLNNMSDTTEARFMDSIKKVYLLIKYFPDFQSLETKTGDLREKVEKRINAAFENIGNNIKKINEENNESTIESLINAWAKEMNYIKMISEDLRNFIPELSENTQKFSNQMDKFIENLIVLPDVSDNVGSKNFASFKEKVNKNLNILEFAKDAAFNDFMKMKTIKEYEEEILKQLEEKCQKLLIEMEDAFVTENKMHSDFEIFKENFQILLDLKSNIKQNRAVDIIKNTIEEALKFLKETVAKILKDMEEIFSKLSQNENNFKINKRKFIKSIDIGLSLEKNLEWVKAYIKPAIKSGFSNFYNKFSDYIDDKKEKFFSLDFNVENDKDLENSVNQLEETLQLEQIKSLRPEETKILREIKEHFKENIEKVIGLNLENLEENKNESELDLEKKNCILNYLNVFKKTNVKNIVAIVDSKLIEKIENKKLSIEKHLKEILHKMDEEIFINLDKIKRNSLKDEKEVDECCTSLVFNITQLSKANALNEITSKQNRSFEKIRSEYKITYDEFSDHFEGEFKPEEIALMLRICRKMSELDSIIQTEAEEKISYESLKNEKFKIYKNKIGDDAQKCSELIKNHDFQAVKNILDKMTIADPKSKSFNAISMANQFSNKQEEIKNLLNSEIKEIRRNLDKSLDDLKNNYSNIWKMTEINKFLVLLLDAQEHLTKYIEYKSDNDKEENIKNKIKSIFNQIIESVETSAINYYEQKKFLNSEKLIFETFKKFKEVKFHQDLEFHDIIKQTDEKIKKSRISNLEKLIKDLDSIEFKAWDYNNIIEEHQTLEHISQNYDDTDPNYKKYSKIFYQKLKKKIDKKFDEILKINDNYKFDNELKIMEDLKEKFPTRLQAFFSAKKDEIENKKKSKVFSEDTKSFIRLLLDENNFPDIIEKLNSSNVNIYASLLKELVEEMNKKKDTLIEKMVQSLKVKDLNGILDADSLLVNYKKAVQQLTCLNEKRELLGHSNEKIKEIYKNNVLDIMTELEEELNSGKKKILLNDNRKLFLLLLNIAQKIEIFERLKADKQNFFDFIKNTFGKEQIFFNDFVKKKSFDEIKQLKSIFIKRKNLEEILNEIFKDETLDKWRKESEIMINLNEFLENLTNEVDKILTSMKNIKMNIFEKMERSQAGSEYKKIQRNFLFLKIVQKDFIDIEEFNKFLSVFDNGKNSFHEIILEHKNEITTKFVEKLFIEKDYIDMRKKLENLKFMSSIFIEDEKILLSYYNSLRDELSQKFNEIKEKACSSSDLSIISEAILKLQLFIIHLPEVSQENSINEILILIIA